MPIHALELPLAGLLCAGSLCAPLLGFLPMMFLGSGMSRHGRFPMGNLSFGGGLSLEDWLLCSALAVSAGSLCGLWMMGMHDAALLCMSAAAVILLVPMILRLSLSIKNQPIDDYLISAAEDVPDEPACMFCIPWLAHGSGERIVEGHCLARSDTAAAMASSIPSCKIATRRSFGSFGHEKGQADLSWNAVEAGARWFCSRAHGESFLFMRAPRSTCMADVGDWARAQLLAAGFELIESQPSELSGSARRSAAMLAAQASELQRQLGSEIAKPAESDLGASAPRL